MKLKSERRYAAALHDAEVALGLLRDLNNEFPHQYVPVQRLKYLIQHIEWCKSLAEDAETRNGEGSFEITRRDGVGGSGR